MVPKNSAVIFHDAVHRSDCVTFRPFVACAQSTPPQDHVYIFHATNLTPPRRHHPWYRQLAAHTACAVAADNDYYSSVSAIPIPIPTPTVTIWIRFSMIQIWMSSHWKTKTTTMRNPLLSRKLAAKARTFRGTSLICYRSP